MKLKKKINKRYTTKQIEIKKIKIKLDIKNKWQDTLEVFQGEEREMEESPPEPNCFSFMNTHLMTTD